MTTPTIDAVQYWTQELQDGHLDKALLDAELAEATVAHDTALERLKQVKSSYNIRIMDAEKKINAANENLPKALIERAKNAS